VKLRSWPEIGSDGDVLLTPYVPEGDNRKWWWWWWYFIAKTIYKTQVIMDHLILQV